MANLDFLIRFAQTHESFRRPELEALTTQLNASPLLTSTNHKAVLQIIDYSPDSPFCIIRFNITQSQSPPTTHLPSTPTSNSSALTTIPQPQHLLSSLATHFITNSILAKSIYELYASAPTYPALHSDNRLRSAHLWPLYASPTTSFKFSVDSYLGKRSESEKREIINGFAYLGFKGEVKMRGAGEEWVVFEEYASEGGQGEVGESGVVDDGQEAVMSEGGVVNGYDDDNSNKLRKLKKRRLKRIFFGRKLGESRRWLADKHDLKRRPYISTTSMDAELALVTVNLALARPGKVFMDPFCGTGGFMVAAAELGAMVLGCDIDGRSFRGRSMGLEKGAGSNFVKYGLQKRFGDCFTADLVNTPLQAGRRWLDGIVCDPPYGVREGLKVLGARHANGSVGGVETTTPPLMIDGVPAHTLPDYIAPKRPYSFVQMLDNILDFAARTLVDEGRLAFWMPSANENEHGEEEATHIPTHPMLLLRHECIQRFNKWSRRLLVYERKIGDGGQVGAGNESNHFQWQQQSNGTSADDLNPFRKRYFEGFAGPPNV